YQRAASVRSTREAQSMFAAIATIAFLSAPSGFAAAQTPLFDGDAVPLPLTTAVADAAAGRTVFIQREKGHCILCHTLPDAGVRFAGNVGPPLAGVGARLTAAQLRGRIVDSTRHDPDTVMPAYFRNAALNRVSRAYIGRTVLSAQEVEDVVAYLLTLR
ncbi:MAG: sulfur oxidation c-type cytochrome SoxX, partial [Betaproteobacteria bacterium]